jgi:hypothetical protein
MAGNELDLAYRLLDLDLVDSEGRRCGKVDDLDLEGGPGEEATVVALVSGPAAWRAGKHGPIGWLAARLFGGSDETALVHLDTIDELGPVIKLNLPAAELGLGRGEEHAAAFIRRIPGA